MRAIVLGLGLLLLFTVGASMALAAPSADVARGKDLWGKYLCARCHGDQGQGLDDPNGILATAKHYAGYSETQGGRDASEADLSRRSVYHSKNSISSEPIWIRSRFLS